MSLFLHSSLLFLFWKSLPRKGEKIEVLKRLRWIGQRFTSYHSYSIFPQCRSMSSSCVSTMQHLLMERSLWAPGGGEVHSMCAVSCKQVPSAAKHLHAYVHVRSHLAEKKNWNLFVNTPIVMIMSIEDSNPEAPESRHFDHGLAHIAKWASDALYGLGGGATPPPPSQWDLGSSPVNQAEYDCVPITVLGLSVLDVSFSSFSHFCFLFDGQVLLCGLYIVRECSSRIACHFPTETAGLDQGMRRLSLSPILNKCLAGKAAADR